MPKITEAPPESRRAAFTPENFPAGTAFFAGGDLFCVVDHDDNGDPVVIRMDSMRVSWSWGWGGGYEYEIVDINEIVWSRR